MIKVFAIIVRSSLADHRNDRVIRLFKECGNYLETNRKLVASQLEK